MQLINRLKQMKDSLICAFALADGWLDSEPAAKGFRRFDTVLENFVSILYKNDKVLHGLSDNSDRHRHALPDLLMEFRSKESIESRIRLARTKLRDQLFDALVLLDEFEDNLRLDVDDHHEEIDSLALAIITMHQCLSELDKLEETAC
jgi:hypothetical protein